MSKFSLSVYLNAYSDIFPSNAPGQNSFKWNRDLVSAFASNPISDGPLSVAPGETLNFFNGSRTLLQDNTTEYDLALAPLETSVYELSWASGTKPNFRTPRTTGADATTQVNVTVNGPVVTFTSSPGQYAKFVGMIPGMTSSVTITANVLGTAGNSVALVGDGSSTISALISAWNTGNPGNAVTLTLGNGAQIPNAPTFATFNGLVNGLSSSVLLTANTAGTIGNSISLVGDGTSDISTLITAWNVANPSNQVTLTSGTGTQIPSAGAAASYTGTPVGVATPVTITSDSVGSQGNSVELLADGISSINTLIANWNISNPSNTIDLISGNGLQIPTFGDAIPLSGGSDAGIIDLGGGLANEIDLSGGATSTPFNLTGGGVVVGDYVAIGSNFNVLNQGTFQIIAVTATSFAVEIITGTNEGPIALGSSFATQIQIFSAAGVQVGDTLVISGGFSKASWGSYEITDVTAQSVEFSSSSALPQESSILTEAITIYSNAKSFVYIESDSVLDVILNTVDIGQIEPFLINNAALPSLPQKAVPGIFMLKSTIYSLSVTNNGLNTATVFFAAVE